MRALRQENDLRDGGSFGSQGAQLLEAVLRCAWDGSPISDVAHVSSAGVSDSSKKNFIARNRLWTHRRTGLRLI